MNHTDEIAHLSDKGYEFMYNNDFFNAAKYFKKAATIASNLVNKEVDEVHDDLKYIIQSLNKLAQEAHLKSCKNEVLPISTISNNSQKFNNPIKKDKEPIQKNVRKKNKTIQKLGNNNKTKYFSIPLGFLPENKNLVNWEPETLMNGIMTITGGSGSGKTETLKGIAKRIIDNNIPCMIIDLHGDIDIDIHSISLDYEGQYSINPLELTSKSSKDGGPLAHINRLMSQFQYALKDRFSPSQNAWLRNLLRFSYISHGIFQKDTKSWDKQPPDYKFLLNLIRFPEEKILASNNQEYIRLLESFPTSTKMAVENRLTPILEHPAFSSGEKIPIQDIANKSFRILLKSLNTIDMQFLAADTLLRQVFSFLKSQGHITPANGEKKFRAFVLIDEVKILTGFRGKLNDPFHILNRIATEARKFGLGLILASQVFKHFGRDVKSNTATKLILRPMDNEETKYCAKELKMNPIKLTTLNHPGEGYLITNTKQEAQHIQLFSSSDMRQN